VTGRRCARSRRARRHRRAGLLLPPPRVGRDRCPAPRRRVRPPFCWQAALASPSMGRSAACPPAHLPRALTRLRLRPRRLPQRRLPCRAGRGAARCVRRRYRLLLYRRYVGCPEFQSRLHVRSVSESTGRSIRLRRLSGKVGFDGSLTLHLLQSQQRFLASKLAFLQGS
jgi:hypothetical protein